MPAKPGIGLERSGTNQPGAPSTQEALQKWLEATQYVSNNRGVIRIAVFVVIGAIIGSLLPGQLWLGGAIAGFFMGLPKNKKKS